MNAPLISSHVAQDHNVHQLCNRWQPGESLYISPHISLLGQGRMAGQTSHENPMQARERLLRLACHQGLSPLVLGLIGFDANHFRLWLPQKVVCGSGSDGSWPCPASPKLSPLDAQDAHLQPGHEDYRQAVRIALNKMAEGQLDKVVLARSLRLTRRIDLKVLLCAALRRNALGYSFVMNPPDEDGALVGASPELILRKLGPRVVSHPLAGSVPRNLDRQEDQRRAAALLQGEKERREHALVVEAVADSLSPFCKHLDVPPNPSLVSTSTLWHLGTEVRGQLKDPLTPSLELALALHPTPAICGSPKAQAMRFIHQHEGFDRAYYGGLLGYCGNPQVGLGPHHEALSNGEWALAIRCAWVEPQAVTLYAGAGLVPGSDPEAELAETSAKLATLLEAMGLKLDVTALEDDLCEALLEPNP